MWQNRDVAPSYKVLCVAGARPNFVKIAPLLRALRSRPHVAAPLVHTGQHYDRALSQVFFDQLGIPAPDLSLDVGSASHAQQTAEIIKRFEPVAIAEQPDAVLVVGDVNSTIGCALVASKLELDHALPWAGPARRRPLVIHVEAGLRSFDDGMPEEINRKLTDVISDLLFASEPSAVTNLRAEGIPDERVHLVGNVMIDTLLAARERALATDVVTRLGLTPGGYGLVTLHRPSNVDDPRQLAELLAVLDDVAAEVPLVFPIHPRTRARMEAGGVRPFGARWQLIDPVGYLEFLHLQSAARLVLTDSGGIQEETTILGVRCLTLRDSTERPATITDGTNLLAGTRRETIWPAFQQAMREPCSDRRPALWDGQAAERIAAAIDRTLAQ
ncbi:MAG: UDP-N-acetylglucosamine 2-epimerase (non-hydrolyzing) [Kofleriaceae bacterium]|nr:UDP-N-acetylglucosamine 2-epimerase (non-hydrolyzing) [Myxococcales bacterium]MCB9564522.1 UDP-N-acetylglucosamine 2-epimerase (non-hydrolyzing) [Kofleriaceae bacterium]